MSKSTAEKNNSIAFGVCHAEPRILFSRGFAEFEKKNRQVEVIFAPKKWIEYIKSWENSFDEEVGELNELNLYKARPKVFSRMKLVGRLWGAVIVEQKFQNENMCRLVSHGGKKYKNILCTLVLEEKGEEDK